MGSVSTDVHSFIHLFIQERPDYQVVSIDKWDLIFALGELTA